MSVDQLLKAYSLGVWVNNLGDAQGPTRILCALRCLLPHKGMAAYSVRFDGAYCVGYAFHAVCSLRYLL